MSCDLYVSGYKNEDVRWVIFEKLLFDVVSTPAAYSGIKVIQS